jgi:hypothetical protein
MKLHPIPLRPEQAKIHQIQKSPVRFKAMLSPYTFPDHAYIL